MKITSILSIFRLYIIFSLLLLASCSTTPKIIYVPTPVKCPAPVIPAEPDYPVKHLASSDKAHPNTVVKSYAASLKMCVGQNRALRRQLEGYKGD